MRILKTGDHLVRAWAEQLDPAWRGLASVQPGIPSIWSGASDQLGAICVGNFDTALEAETAAYGQAVTSLKKYLKSVGLRGDPEEGIAD